MATPIGPHDGRKAKRKRCDPCVKRKIKCNGGNPCENCKKTNRQCHMVTKPVAVVPIFIHSARSGGAKPAACPRKEQGLLALPGAVPSKRESYYLPYFFSSFLQTNAFTSTNLLFSKSLLSMSKDVPELRDAIEAVGALHLTRREQLTANGDSTPKYEAMKAYARSVRCVQAKITSSNFSQDPSALWTTFLLGLFELMRDASGVSWLSHFLHGTSTLLQLQDPLTLSQPGPRNSARRSFFLATRIFEIARALIYAEPTFLSQPVWIAATAELWNREDTVRTPREALFDILPPFVDLHIRMCQFMNEYDTVSPISACRTADSLAHEGLTLQALLHRWRHDTAEWTLTTQARDTDTDLDIGYAYHHATSIYLDGTFSYFETFKSPDAPLTPMLSRLDIEQHVISILYLSRMLLDRGVAGVLLFFPLRVAGARAYDSDTRREILRLLMSIAERGFVVAQAIAGDLEGLWGWGTWSAI